MPDESLSPHDSHASKSNSSSDQVGQLQTQGPLPRSFALRLFTGLQQALNPSQHGRRRLLAIPFVVSSLVFGLQLRGEETALVAHDTSSVAVPAEIQTASALSAASAVSETEGGSRASLKARQNASMPELNNFSALTTRDDVQPAGQELPEEVDRSIEAPIFSPPFTAQINVEKANLRNGPGTIYDKLGALVAGDSVTVTARHEDWFVAQASDGQLIWIAGELVDLPSDLAAKLPQAEEIPPPPPPLVATVAEDNLNLRDGPSIEYVGMTKLDSGVHLDLLARYGDWLRVQAEDGATGWVTSEYLSIQEGVFERLPEVSTIPPANPDLIGTLAEDYVNLRSGPSTKYKSLGKLQSGTELTLLAQYKDWYKVETPRGSEGWISGDLLNVSSFIERRVPYTDNIPALPKPQSKPKPRSQSKPAAKAAAPSIRPAGDVGDVVSFAMQFRGLPYVWGAAGPRAFDCSGFTQYVYKQFGLWLPHSAAAQYSSRYGQFISSREHLAPGDLVFFANTYKRGISHVGIYIGNGNVVQAISPGQGVGVSSVYSSYWGSKYAGGLRPYR